MVNRVREPVAWFAKEMESKLRKDDYKKHWSEYSILFLHRRLMEEVQELSDEVDRKIKPEAVISECVDVANFAMMIADNIRKYYSKVTLELTDDLGKDLPSTSRDDKKLDLVEASKD